MGAKSDANEYYDRMRCMTIDDTVSPCFTTIRLPPT
ncbi:hypothetical protein ATJ93_3989 [Halopiger aswanensis]|uniref:Uncharacterized protein n=1 Tax=Halopiger aswanensis TaxID=148449 RepID=A0A419W110_9EURY|nr:hypothetical protein ATJ93_3989 [Halopiger aswanensis]